MKIKRYMAISMRAALAQVRAEQGPDAVILSSRRVEEGIEVIAAIDYDEALFMGAAQRRTPAAADGADAPAPEAAAVPAVRPEPLIVDAVLPRGAAPCAAAAGVGRSAPEPRAGAAPRAAVVGRRADEPRGAATVGAAAHPAPSDAAVLPDGGYLAVRAEIKDLRELLQGGLAQLAWNDQRMREPLRAKILEQLTAMDIAPDVALSLASRAPRRTKLKDPANIYLALLLQHLLVVDKLSPVNPGVIALVGPTGAGKTTTIAKLAARWSMKHGSRDLALVSTDGHRIGAREQLMTYARILGAPMHTANGGKELARVIERLKSKKLVLIDTAGMGPRDSRLTEHLAALQIGAAGARVLLALPAHAEAHALDEIVRSFARISPAACILTKVDEAASLGAVLSTALRHRLRIAYLCNGQRVPEDLHAAHERRVWLIRAAHKLKQRTPTPVNEDYLARNFGGETAHA
jgi:flagellar biosynthesis protein FlhF